MKTMGRLTAWGAVLAMPGVAWVLARTAGTLWNGRGAIVQVDDLVAMGAAGIGAAVASYLAVTSWAMLLGALVRGGRSVPRSVAAIAPVQWQRVTATALGVTISAGLATPALASQPAAPHVGWSESVAAQQSAPARAAITHPGRWTGPVATAEPPEDSGSLSVGFAPAPTPQEQKQASHGAALPETAPVGTALVRTAEPNPAESVQTYTVAPGDSLWRITATLLGPGASDLSISRAWPKLYTANAAAVGTDPALIHPGQVLTVPHGLSS